MVKKEFQVCFRMFFRKIKKNLAYIWLFLSNLAGNKNIKIADNQFRNILSLFDVLSNFPFTSSETMCGYYL